jgi:inosine-uridine nucleoside N-ribohydrolase
MPPVLIDTDPGIDDALALLLAWGSPELSVQAIATVAGNVPLDTATANLLRLVALRRPVPTPRMAVGAAQPLVRQLMTAVRYHGADGLGDLADWAPVVPSVLERATDLIREVGRRPGRSVLIALGPLTNLAEVLALDREALGRFERVVIMGGAVDVPGNVTPSAEFNFHVDPDAVARVLASGARLDLVPLDATRQAVVERAALLSALAASPGPLADKVAAFTERGFRIDTGRGERGMILHDPLAVGVAVDATLVEWESVCLEVGPIGETRRGRGAANCRIAGRVDSDRFLRIFLDRLCPR